MTKSLTIDMPCSIGIVVARFNQPVTDALLAGTKQRLHEHGFVSSDLHIVPVPGAVELPLAAQRLAQCKHIAAVICLGAVIKGETDHYDYVCQQVSYGIQRVMLSTNKPIIFGVLTTQTAEQAFARVGGEKGHKGEEAADAAYDMIAALREFPIVNN